MKKLLRPITSLVLSALVIFEPAEVPAQEPVRNPRLAEMLRDIPAEVARFQANRAEQGEPVGFRKIPLESEIAVILKSRDRHVGLLRTAQETPAGFGLLTRDGYLEFAYDQVQTYSIIRLDGWASPEVASGIPAGQEIELHLQDGRQRKGRLLRATDSAFLLMDDRAPISFQDVQRIKYSGGGMSTTTIVLIGVGVFFAVGLIVFLTADIGGPGFTGGLP